LGLLAAALTLGSGRVIRITSHVLVAIVILIVDGAWFLLVSMMGYLMNRLRISQPWGYGFLVGAGITAVIFSLLIYYYFFTTFFD